MDKRIVTVDLYSQDGQHNYTGRCVGLLTKEEFSAVVDRPDLQKKLITSQTVPLIDIANVKDIQGLRSVIVIKTELTEKKTKRLFISEPIEMVSQFIEPDDLTLIGVEGSYMLIEEKIGV